MRRRSSVIACVSIGLLTLVNVAVAGDGAAPDPTAARVEKAKSAFTQKVERFKAELLNDLDAKESQARAKGDKKLVDQVKTERAAFAEHLQLPHSVSTANYESRVKQARGEVEAAYAALIKDLVKRKKDDRAAEVDKELQAFLNDADAAAGAIDLLALVDLSKDGFRGRWSREKRGVTNALDAHTTSLLQLPYTPPEEYELQLDVERTKGGNDLHIVGVVGGRSFTAVLDGYAGTVSGITLEDRFAKQNETTVPGPFFTTGKPATITARITKTGVTISRDDKPVVKYAGPPERMQVCLLEPLPKGIICIAVIPGSTFRIDAIRLVPITGKGKPLR